MTLQTKCPPRPGGPEAGEYGRHPDHTATPDDFKAAIETEKRLLCLGWRDPSELARVADAYGLHVDDFRDRLCGVAVGYLRECGDDNRTPSWPEAVDYLARHGFRNADDFYFILVDKPVPDGDTVTDLVEQVQRAADDRAAEDCRYVTREAVSLTLHALGCPRCQRCAKPDRNGARPRSVGRSKRRRKAVVCCG